MPYSNKVRLFFSIAFIILLEIMVITHGLANPIPSTGDEADEAGGGCLPEDLSTWIDSDRLIFLKSEIVNVTLDQTKAKVNALYVFKNEATNDTILNIKLPFSRKPSNFQLLVDGEKIPFSRIEEETITVPNKYPSLRSTHTIWDPNYVISFSLSFEGLEKKQVRVFYDREYTISESLYDHKIVSEFRYIIGTSRWWKYPLESAHFEFWILKKIFDRGVVLTMTDGDVSASDMPFFFVNSSTKDTVCLSVHYKDWMPINHDYLVFYWEKNRPFLQTGAGLLFFYSSIILVFVFIVTGSILLQKRFSNHKLISKSAKLVSYPLIIFFGLLALIVISVLVLAFLITASYVIGGLLFHFFPSYSTKPQETIIFILILACPVIVVMTQFMRRRISQKH
ncbi:MAG: hypothetical protein ACFFBQ_18230 [Promethearchaeota archaeon]